MDEAFVQKLDALRELLGHPLVISSGYRCPEHNRVVSTTGLDGPHTTGLAADLRCYGAEAWKLLSGAMRLEFRGIGVSQRSGDVGARFIHLDMMPAGELRPRVWSY
jgi:uncharacterized protein YcbK (DUF882 family)